MDVMTDGLLIAGTVFAGLYCWILARRVRALKSLDGGLGGAIVTLTRQIELARATLDEARAGSRETRQDLVQLTARADAASAQLRLLLAAAEKARPASPEPGPEASRRRDAAPPRLVSPAPPEPEADPGPPSDPADAVPKPRRPLSLDAMLRRRAPVEPASRSEADLIEALSALAAGGDR